MNLTFVLVLVVYVAIMIAIAAWFGRSAAMKDGEDFVLAGKSLPTWVLAGTLLATFVGSGSIIGGANFIYTNGPLAGALFFGGTFCGIAVLYFLAPKVRKNGFHTVPELFEAKFGRPVRTVGTIIVLVAFIGITAYQFTGAGYILTLITPLSTTQATIIATVLITFLSLSGGLKSVAWTDLLSAVLIVASLLAVLIWVFVVDLGGFGSYVGRLDPAFKSVTGVLSPLQILGFFLPLFLLILGDQNMHQRLAAARSPKVARNATILFFFGAALIVAPIILLASSSTILMPGTNPDMAILALAEGEFTPSGMGAVLLVASLALIVTTGSSYLLTCSGNIVYDLIYVRNKTKGDSKRGVVVGRLSVLAIAVLGFILVQFFESVLALQMYAYSMYGAAITPVILAALFWKRVTPAGAMCSMIVGGAVTIIWEATGRSETLNSAIPALPTAVVVLIVVSLLTKRRRPQAEASAEHRTLSQEV
ncbi:sodium:solute symporter family protein [Brevibacterium sp.]|uniref:sodium:solute symporter family protein n=1 Tax=Brevibacterium sp. TaxID=1701 RepID=UPI002810C705|nr:sodium:solute symporter family protein [Brevibacterium sp.]